MSILHHLTDILRGYRFRSEVHLQDDFVSGSTSTAIIGSLGFAASNGTTSYVAATSIDHPGIVRRDTSSVSGTVASLSLNASQFVLFGMNSPAVYDVTWIAKLTQTDANTTVRIGFCDGPSSGTPGNGVFFEKLDDDTVWFGLNNPVGSGGTRVSTGITVDTEWHIFRVIASATSSIFEIDGVRVVNTATQMASTAFNPFIHIITSAAASKTMDIDFFQLRITGISR